MEVLAVVPKRAPSDCYRAFVDASLLVLWVPGLRKANVVARDPTTQLAREIYFEYLTSLTYSLVYRYDAAKLEVAWEPRANKKDGVTGFVRFAPFDGGTRITYSLDGATQRSAEAAIAAFVDWMRVR